MLVMEEEKKPLIRGIVRIAGTDLTGQKTLERALWKIKGVSHMYAHAVITVSKMQTDRKVGSLSKEELMQLEEIIKNPLKYGIPEFLINRPRDIRTGKPSHVVSSDLEIIRKFDIKRQTEMRTRRGIRHQYGLKVRGQSTHSTGRKGTSLGVKRKALQKPAAAGAAAKPEKGEKK